MHRNNGTTSNSTMRSRKKHTEERLEKCCNIVLSCKTDKQLRNALIYVSAFKNQKGVKLKLRAKHSLSHLDGILMGAVLAKSAEFYIPKEEIYELIDKWY